MGAGERRGRRRRARTRASRSCRRTRRGRPGGGGRRSGSGRASGRRRSAARPPSPARSAAAAGRVAGARGTGARTDARRGVRRTARWRQAAAWSVAESTRGSLGAPSAHAARDPDNRRPRARYPRWRGRSRVLRYTLDPLRAAGRPSVVRATPGDPMTEILTESFCERCGTRYTFESAAPRVAAHGRQGPVARASRTSSCPTTRRWTRRWPRPAARRTASHRPAAGRVPQDLQLLHVVPPVHLRQLLERGRGALPVVRAAPRPRDPAGALPGPARDAVMIGATGRRHRRTAPTARRTTTAATRGDDSTAPTRLDAMPAGAGGRYRDAAARGDRPTSRRRSPRRRGRSAPRGRRRRPTTARTGRACRRHRGGGRRGRGAPRDARWLRPRGRDAPPRPPTSRRAGQREAERRRPRPPPRRGAAARAASAPDESLDAEPEVTAEAAAAETDAAPGGRRRSRLDAERGRTPRCRVRPTRERLAAAKAAVALEAATQAEADRLAAAPGRAQPAGRRTSGAERLAAERRRSAERIAADASRRAGRGGRLAAEQAEAARPAADRSGGRTSRSRSSKPRQRPEAAAAAAPRRRRRAADLADGRPRPGQRRRRCAGRAIRPPSLRPQRRRRRPERRAAMAGAGLAAIASGLPFLNRPADAAGRARCPVGRVEPRGRSSPLSPGKSVSGGDPAVRQLRAVTLRHRPVLPAVRDSPRRLDPGAIRRPFVADPDPRGAVQQRLERERQPGQGDERGRQRARQRRDADQSRHQDMNTWLSTTTAMPTTTAGTSPSATAAVVRGSIR